MANCAKELRKTVKLQAKAGKTVAGGQLKKLNLDQGGVMSTSQYGGLLQLIADMFDCIAEGRDMYMIIGATSNRSAYVCTVKDAGTPTSVYGDTLAELCTSAATLL